MSDDLPPIDQTWGNFTTGERSSFDIIDRFLANVDDDRRLEVDRLLDTFEFDGAEPALRFGHFLYPHHPWEVTADGHRTGAGSSPGGQGMGWVNDAWLVGQGYQRHILQTQYADTVVGAVIDRLREEGVYDEALVMVVADHGITIGPGVDNQRLISEDTIGTIAAVPLFVKYPVGQDGVEPGTIDDARAETVDILPTIGDVTRTDVPWGMEGLSLLDPERSERTESVMVGREGPVSIGVSGEEKLAAAGLKETWFPGGDPWLLTPPGWQEWLGRPLSDAAAADDEEGVMLTVRQQDLLDDVPSEPGPPSGVPLRHLDPRSAKRRVKRSSWPGRWRGEGGDPRVRAGWPFGSVRGDDPARAPAFRRERRVLWLAEGDASDPAFVR